MIVYRLSKPRYADDLMGTGARKAGGRWNSRGVPMLYTSQSIALCAVEVAVHMPLGILPKNYMLITIEIPEHFDIIDYEMKDLPINWAVSLHSQDTQMVGDHFINKCKEMVMKVPSAVIQGESNFLINPYHADFNCIKILSKEVFTFDKRLFVR